jgi:hypothetical protein
MDSQSPSSASLSANASPKEPLASSASFLQGLVLCFLALVCAGLQISPLSGTTAILDPFLLLGLGCLLGFFIFPQRLFIPAALMLPLGVVNVLASTGVLNGNYAAAYYFIGLSISLLALAQAVRLKRGWVQPGALTPGLFLLLFGVVLLAAANSGALGQILYSLWLPTMVLGALGLGYTVMAVLKHARS